MKIIHNKFIISKLEFFDFVLLQRSIKHTNIIKNIGTPKKQKSYQSKCKKDIPPHAFDHSTLTGIICLPISLEKMFKVFETITDPTIGLSTFNKIYSPFIFPVNKYHKV